MDKRVFSIGADWCERLGDCISVYADTDGTEIATGSTEDRAVGTEIAIGSTEEEAVENLKEAYPYLRDTEIILERR